MTLPNKNSSLDGEQRYRNLFEHAPICILVIDLTASPETVLEVNRWAELIYGYSAAEMVGKPFIQLLPEEGVPSIMALMKLVRQGERMTAVTTHQHRDGTRFPVRVIAAPDPPYAGRMIVIVEEITAEIQRRSEAEAIVAERRRIAREIHDGAAQSLAGLRFKLALWSHLADAAPDNMRAALDELQTVLNDVIVDLRRAIFALRPVDLDALGFFPALTQLVGDFGDHNLIRVRLALSGPQEALPAIYELPLYRIIQEGLSNIGQHARASSLLLRLTVDEAGGVVMALSDDGRGFDPHLLGAVDRDGHFGLRQMRERIVDLGGTLDIHSAPGHGTELVVTLPPVIKELNRVHN